MRTRSTPRPIVLDAGGLIALDRQDRRIAVLLERVREVGGRILIPAGPLGQVWRDGARQARIASLLNSSEVEIVDLTGSDAKLAGSLCGRRHTSDVIDASVVILARRINGLIVTSDPDDLRQLDPNVALETRPTSLVRPTGLV